MTVAMLMAVMAFVGLMNPLGQVAFAKNIQTQLDEDIENLRARYGLVNGGWDLYSHVYSSISSQYSSLLADVDRRWRIELNKAKREYGNAATNRLGSWQRMTQLAASASIESKLRMVNDFFNAVAFQSDEDNWGERDYWSSPVELLTKNAGDCEDYAIAKYITLVEMGVPVDSLRITYVKANRLGSAHMVLAYYGDSLSEPVILDNVSSKILPASARSDLEPVFSFNG